MGSTAAVIVAVGASTCAVPRPSSRSALVHEYAHSPRPPSWKRIVARAERVPVQAVAIAPSRSRDASRRGKLEIVPNEPSGELVVTHPAAPAHTVATVPPGRSGPTRLT